MKRLPAIALMILGVLVIITSKIHSPLLDSVTLIISLILMVTGFSYAIRNSPSMKRSQFILAIITIGVFIGYLILAYYQMFPHQLVPWIMVGIMFLFLMAFVIISLKRNKPKF